MRRGFKAHAKRLALEVREEIGLTDMDVFDPWALADEYGVDVLQLRDVGCATDSLIHFTVTNPSVFSGALVPMSPGAVIIENDSHPLIRRRYTASHEMAHVLLEHSFSTTLVNERGCRIADPDQEDEATELGAELVLPSSAAMRLARRQVTDDVAAIKFGVSVEVSRWRLNASGARKIAGYRAASKSAR